MERKKKVSSKKSNAPKMIDLSVQQRRLALQKQKQCDTIALHIVRKLIDCPVEEDVFLQSLKYMNQCHYQDIVEERAISKMCGYPICGNKIPDMPNKKYHISTKSNKVYDITDRKNYCSNYCYKAGTYIKNQMLTSPLWFRDKEKIPNFHLLSRRESGIPGVEVDQGIAKVNVNGHEQFISVSKFTQDMINDMPNEVCDDLNDKSTITDRKFKKPETKPITKTKDERGKNKLNEKASKINDENTKSINDEKDKYPIGKQNEDSHFYSSLYMPSLADILKENAEYFTKEFNNNSEEKMSSETTTINTKPDNNDNDSNNKNENAPEVKKLEKPVKTKSKGFDRTIINVVTENSKDAYTNVKGILSKGKTLKYKRGEKRVSFTEGHSERLYVKGEKIRDKYTNTVEGKFQKPVVVDNENSKKSIYRNTNVVGIVQERSSTYKYELSNNNVTKPMEKNVENNENIESESIKHDKSQSNVANNDTSKTTNKEDVKLESQIENEITYVENRISELEKSHFQNNETYIAKTENEITESNLISTIDINKNEENIAKSSNESKQKRINRLKNSAAYKTANNMSKCRLANVQQNTEQPDINIRMKQCLQEWLTIETTLFLYGEDHVKKILSDKAYKQFLNRKKNLELDDLKQKQYDAICKRLNLMELEDRKFDESVTGKKLRALPKYEELREQAETMDLKVQAFYSGFYEAIEEDIESVTELTKEEEEESCIVKGPPAVLPLVDSKDLAQIRRKIFLLSLQRVVPAISEVLKQCPYNILSDLKKLTETFELNANNIVFKSAEWPAVAVLLIKILAMRDKELQCALDSEEGKLYITSLSAQYNTTALNFEEFVVKTTEINNYLDDSINKVNNIA